MAKPLIDDTRWGQTTGGVESTQVTDPAATPASGLRDTGYPDHHTPTAKIWTRLFNRSHKWFKYLDAVIDNSDNWSFPAGVLVGATLGVVGAINVGNNQNILLQGTGRVRHGPVTVPLSCYAFLTNNPSTLAVNYTNSRVNNAGATVLSLGAAFSLATTKRLTAITVRVIDNATGPHVITPGLSARDNTGAVVATGVTFPSSSGSGSLQTLAASAGLPLQLQAGFSYFLTVASSGGTSAVSVLDAFLTLDDP